MQLKTLERPHRLAAVQDAPALSVTQPRSAYLSLQVKTPHACCACICNGLRCRIFAANNWQYLIATPCPLLPSRATLLGRLHLKATDTFHQVCGLGLTNTSYAASEECYNFSGWGSWALAPACHTATSLFPPVSARSRLKVITVRTTYSHFNDLQFLNAS